MSEYHTKIRDVSAQDLAREVANTQYHYSRDFFANLENKFNDLNYWFSIYPNLSPNKWNSFVEPNRRFANGLCLVRRDLNGAWNCCKNQEGNEKHPIDWKGLSVDDLAKDVGDISWGYDYLNDFFFNLTHEFINQARIDGQKEHVKLSSHLTRAAQDLIIARLNVVQLQQFFNENIRPYIDVK